MQKLEIINYSKGVRKELFDELANEIKITLIINDEEILSFLMYPDDYHEMVIGFLYSEGMISSMDDVIDRNFDDKSGKYYIEIKNKVKNLNKPTLTSGCAKGTTFTDLEDIDPFMDRMVNYALFIDKQVILDLMREFQSSSEVFKRTGAVHLAALTTTTRMINFSEDIGRHNAVDKILGKALLEGIDLYDKIVLTSGRISSEIISKVIVSGIPIIISRSAPTARAVEFGKKFGVTLVGFCRANRFNVYSHPSRIK
jgi:FdhD protein